MTTTQIPRIVQNALRKGSSAGSGHMQHGSMGAMKTPKSSGMGSGGGGGGGKSGGSSGPFAGGFDTEGGTYDSANATTASGHIGPFGWGGELTEGAKRVRQKMTDQDTAAGKALNQLSEQLAQGSSFQDALRGMMQNNPTGLHSLVAGGLFKSGLEGVAKSLNEASTAKSSNFVVSGNQIIDKGAATSRTIQTEDGPMAPPTQGSFGMIEDPNNPGQHIIVSTAGSAPGKAGPRPVITQPNATTGVGGPEATAARTDQASSGADLNRAKTEGQEQKNADPYTGKPYKIPKADGDYLNVAPTVLGSIEIMRRWAPDANGLLTGPAGTLATKLFGSNEANMVWEAAKNTLKQSLSIGGVPSHYAGGMKQFLDTLPQNWENARFNTTELAASANAFRQIGNAKIANVEQENGGRPYTAANQNQLREVGIIPPSAGWDNPMALVKGGPEALQNSSYDQLNWLADHQHMLSPAEKALVKAEAMRKAAAGATPSQQPQTPQPTQDAAQQPQQQQADLTPTPESQVPQQQPQGTPAAPAPDNAPLAPNPRLGTVTPDPEEEEG